MSAAIASNRSELANWMKLFLLCDELAKYRRFQMNTKKKKTQHGSRRGKKKKKEEAHFAVQPSVLLGKLFLTLRLVASITLHIRNRLSLRRFSRGHNAAY